jgi:hypothetical protein
MFTTSFSSRYSWVMLNPQPLPPRYLRSGIIIVSG